MEDNDNYIKTPKLPKDRPLTEEEKLSFELYEKKLREKLKSRVLTFNNGEYGFRFNGQLYTIKFTE